VKQIKKILFVVLPFILVVFFYGIWLSGKYAVPIVMYHSVENSQGPAGIVVSPKSFAKQMDYLQKKHYKVLSLDELVSLIKEKKPMPRKSVVITFDDGYENNYLNAYPALKKYGFPATIFVIVDLIGREGYLTWDEISEMEKYGITVGSHTLDHTYLPGVPVEWQEHQIVESKKILEARLGHRVDYFVYPSGGFTEETKAIVKGAGYKGACSTNRGYQTLNKDEYELKRVRFKNTDSTPAFWAKLSGYYNFFKNPRDPS